MTILKCDICGKEFSSNSDKEQFIVCPDCKNINDETTGGKGDDGDE